MKYKSLYFSEFGKPELVIKVKNKYVQELRDKEVLVEMLVFPINLSDLIPVTGVYAYRTKLPNTPGFEGVGIVKDVGDYVDKKLIGKIVLPLRSEGTWQELVVTSVQNIIEIPYDMDLFTASQLYINPVTAWLICTRELSLTHDEYLIVNACSSSIGKIFIQLSKILGFKIIEVIRNNKYCEGLYNLGADYIINTSEDNLYSKVMTITNNRGVKAAVDLIGGMDGNNLSRCVKKKSFFIVTGLLSKKPVDYQYIDSLPISLKIFHLRYWINQCSQDEYRECFKNIIKLIENNHLMLLTPKNIYLFEDYLLALENSKYLKEKSFVIFNKKINSDIKNSDCLV